MFGEPKEYRGIALEPVQIKVLVEAAHYVAANAPDQSHDPQKLQEAATILESAERHTPQLLRHLLKFTAEVCQSMGGPGVGKAKIEYALSPYRVVKDTVEPPSQFENASKRLGIVANLQVPEEFWALVHAAAALLEEAIEGEVAR
jgi:hypothetical protein